MPAPPLLWLALAALLLAAVLAGFDSDGLLLVGGLAALLQAPLAATLLGFAIPAQLLVFSLTVAVAYLLVQRWSRRLGEGRITPAAGAGTAEVIAPFNAGGEGRVRWQGQSWAALNLEPELALAPGDPVDVMGREGNRLQVVPQAHHLAELS